MLSNPYFFYLFFSGFILAVFPSCGKELKLYVKVADSAKSTALIREVRKVDILSREGSGQIQFQQSLSVADLNQPISMNADLPKESKMAGRTIWEARAYSAAGDVLLFGATEVNLEDSEQILIEISQNGAIHSQRLSPEAKDSSFAKQQEFLPVQVSFALDPGQNDPPSAHNGWKVRPLARFIVKNPNSFLVRAEFRGLLYDANTSEAYSVLCRTNNSSPIPMGHFYLQESIREVLDLSPGQSADLWITEVRSRNGREPVGPPDQQKQFMGPLRMHGIKVDWALVVESMDQWTLPPQKDIQLIP